MPPGRPLLLEGFLHLGEVYRELRRDFPLTARFLVGQVFIESATGTLTTAAILILDNNGLAAWIGPYLAVVMISMMFGPPFHEFVAGRTSVKASLVMAIVAFVVLMVLFIFAATSPLICWCFAPFVGVIYGWYFPGLNGTLASLIPGGHEGDMAGLNLFTSTVLSWVPPLIITVFNQMGMLDLGLLSLPAFWVVGAAIIYTIDMEQVKKYLCHRGLGEKGWRTLARAWCSSHRLLNSSVLGRSRAWRKSRARWINGSDTARREPRSVAERWKWQGCQGSLSETAPRPFQARSRTFLRDT